MGIPQNIPVANTVRRFWWWIIILFYFYQNFPNFLLFFLIIHTYLKILNVSPFLNKTSDKITFYQTYLHIIDKVTKVQYHLPHSSRLNIIVYLLLLNMFLCYHPVANGYTLMPSPHFLFSHTEQIIAWKQI